MRLLELKGFVLISVQWKKSKGFTLAELLIALLILGEISTFTIPKIIVAQANARYNAVAREDIAALSGAHQQHMLSGNLSSSTKITSLTQYMNYIAFDTSSIIDDAPGSGSSSCNSTYPCIRMHNGSVMQWRDTVNFGGTNTTNAMWVHIDPDGVLTDGSTNGPGKALSLFLYYNGRISDEGSITAGTANSAVTYNPDPTKVPSWFRW
jgi:prepilin-type N-terminal cleavage/methylation domain-containing protein